MIIHLRASVIINADLLAEAAKYAGARSKSALIEQALKTYVELMSREDKSSAYRKQAAKLQSRLAGIVLRESAHELIRSDRQR